MGPKPRGPAVEGLALGGLTLLAALAPAPWTLGPVFLALALVPGPVALGVGLGAAWAASTGGPATAVLLGVAVLRLAWRRSAWGIALMALAVGIAARQEIAAAVLPAAVDRVPAFLVAAILAAGPLGCPDGRWPRLALGGVGVVLLLRLARVWTAEGAERLERAEAVGAVRLVYADLAADPALAPALLRARPRADAAAAGLPTERALDLGWRPVRAEGRVVEVARALERRGRGGEALRLLARHPREGEVDWWRGLFERTQGEPVRWRGAVLPGAPILPGEAGLGWDWTTNRVEEVCFTSRAPLTRLELTGRGSAADDGWPVVEVALDGTRLPDWLIADPARWTWEGPVEPGPHRLRLAFVNDTTGADGDRNVAIDRLTGR